MSLSLMVTGMIRAALPDVSWTPLVENLGYTVGFIATVMGRQQLFTENTVTAVIPVLDEGGHRTKLIRLIRLWCVVLATNLIGVGLVAFALAYTDVFHPAVKHAFLQLGVEAISGTPLTIFLRALIAGWLIALMVWLLPAAEGSRVLVIAILTYVVGLGGFAHVIAGSAEVLYAVASHAVTWPHYLAGYLLPTFLGNSLGGVIMVSLLNYAQVAVKSDEEQPGGS
jgi:formate/nitrite transporter FocA (FNT family)